jgi:hypothetical protein
MKSLAMRPDPTLSEKPFGAGMAWVVSVAGQWLCVLDLFFSVFSIFGASWLRHGTTMRTGVFCSYWYFFCVFYFCCFMAEAWHNNANRCVLFIVVFFLCFLFVVLHG